MMSVDYNKLAIDTAALSPAEKRKVGAVYVLGSKYAAGYNHNGAKPCELPDGSTDPSTIHAEIAAITAFKQKYADCENIDGGVMYVTHTPCVNCNSVISGLNAKTILVDDFIKFDSNKLMYDLIPPSALEGIAKVLTHGAKKYKPNNWRKGSKDRYIGATMRHFEAWRKGERFDQDSGFHHLEHVLTNICFLLELEDKKHK